MIDLFSSKEMTNKLFLPQITDDSLGYKVTRTLGYLKPYEDSFAGSKHNFEHTIGPHGFSWVQYVYDNKNGIRICIIIIGCSSKSVK